MKIWVVLAIVSVSAAACGGADDVGGDDERAQCAELYQPGVTLPDGAEDTSCIDEAGDELTLAVVSYECENGDQLLGNQYGVGWLASDRIVIDLDVMGGPAVGEIEAACS